MGGGLVLFGVGGNVSGGLLDALKDNQVAPAAATSSRSGSRPPRQLRRHAAAERPGVGQRGQARASRSPAPATATTTRPAPFTDKGKAELQRGRPGVEPLPGARPEEDRHDRGHLHGPGLRARRAQQDRQAGARLRGRRSTRTAKPTFDQYRNLAIYSLRRRARPARATSPRQGARAGAQGPAQPSSSSRSTRRRPRRSSRRSSPAAANIQRRAG